MSTGESSRKRPTYRASALTREHPATPAGGHVPAGQTAEPEARPEQEAMRRSGQPKQRMPFQAAPDTLARIRATEHTARLREGFATMSEWMEDAMLRECQRLENEYNDGQPFPLGTPRRGRPAAH
ncbi:MAG: hypothetical protein L0H79_06920 [Intrasporangium sp.]|uniref:ParB family protein n=1 Tax=Intrasporangium sp. TaxID=1925024 RepID=UPI002649B85F|nr:hypothetical protein [Intrasporangium sp.]MDN5795470.1 hypothetical protein [Intrasporangium sp.]